MHDCKKIIRKVLYFCIYIISCKYGQSMYKLYIFQALPHIFLLSTHLRLSYLYRYINTANKKAMGQVIQSPVKEGIRSLRDDNDYASHA